MHARKTSNAPCSDIYHWIVIISTVLVEGHPGNMCAKLFKKQSYVFLQEYILKFRYIYIYIYKQLPLVVIFIIGS